MTSQEWEEFVDRTQGKNNGSSKEENHFVKIVQIQRDQLEFSDSF